MNNIVNIRMGHYVLAADEDAANLLRKYSASIKNRYGAEEGADEIVQDIEERIGELLQQKQTDNKRNFTILKDAEEVLAQMGPAEGDETISEKAASGSQNYDIPPSRRLFRDTDHSIIGGVCSGLASYFSIDPVILRLIWVVTVFVFGFGVPVYIVLWVIVPAAKTTAEKLMMRGQTPNLQNIEENVKAEFRRVEQNFNNGGRDRFSRFVRNLLEYAGKFIMIIFKIALSFAFAVTLAVLIALLVTITSGAFHIHTWNLVIEGQDGLNTCLTVFGDPLLIKAGMLTFLVMAMIVIALRLFVPSRNATQVRMTRRYLTGGLVLLFLILFFTGIFGLVRMGHRNENLNFTEDLKVKGDTLYLSSEGEVPDADGFYTCNSLVDIAISSDSNFYLEQRNTYWGFSGRSSSYRIDFPKQFRAEGNHLWIRESNKVTDLTQHGVGWAKLTLYVPKGKTVKTGKRFFNGSHYPHWIGENQTYKMDSTGFSMPMGTSGQNVVLQDKLKSIIVKGRFEVQIIESVKERMELVSGPILFHRDWIDMRDGELELENDADIFNDQLSVIRIYINDLQKLEVSGVSSVWLRNIKAGRLELESSGASHIRGNVTAGFVHMDIEGVSEIELQGAADRLEAEVDGASSMSCPALKIASAEIDVSGSSSATAWVTSSIHADCTGASKLYLKGKPPVSEIDTRGASRFQQLQ